MYLNNKKRRLSCYSSRMYKMNPISHKHQKKFGFTLTEVMVSLSILSFLTPAILSTFIFFNRIVVDGVKRNSNLEHARYFEQFFTKKVMATQNTALGIDGPGTQILFNMPSAGAWNNASFQYRPNSKDILFISSTGVRKKILENVLPLQPGSTRIFSKTGKRVTCRLRVGEKDKQSVEIRFSVAARN